MAIEIRQLTVTASVGGGERHAAVELSAREKEQLKRDAVRQSLELMQDRARLERER